MGPSVANINSPQSTNKVGSSIVLKSLSILLGLFFIFIGCIKLSPHLSKDLHKDLRKEYVKYAKVFPFTGTFDFRMPSKWYRRVVGCLEITCGFAMAIIPNHKIKNAANLTLLALMCLAVYSHYMISDPFERCGPALVFTFMLCGRFVVWYQASRQSTEAGGSAIQSNGLKED